MNSNFVRQCVGLAVGLLLFGGCAKPSAQTPPVVSAIPLAPNVAGGAGTVEQDPAPLADEPAPKIEQRVPPAQPANMSAGVSEIVKLAQSGVSDDIMITYVTRYPNAYNLTADQIVYLNDLGVSTNVLGAMLTHDGNNAAIASASPAVPEAQPNSIAQAPAIPATAMSATAQIPVATAPATPSTDVAYFYDTLSPYGSWVHVSGYGWCWQPTVAITVRGWQPYCDRGRWYWSDSGWYWQSDYTWGWAAFHYGRWYCHPSSGWVWMPGTVWGPSWVSWRYTDGYCGWAPLPPSAVWVAGHGFSYHGSHVSVGFDFGLSVRHYSFVSVGSFCDYHPRRHVVPHTTVVNIYNKTKVVNNYHVGRGAVVNHGVGRDTIAQRSRTEVRNVRVQESSLAGASDRMNKMERKGNDLVVYRPQLAKEPPVKPAVVQTRMAQQAQQHARANDNTRDDRAARNVEPTENRNQNNGRGERAGRSAVTEPTRNNTATPIGGTPTVESRRNNNDVQRSSPQRVEPNRNAGGDNANRGNNNNNQRERSNVARLSETPTRTAPVAPIAPAQNAPVRRENRMQETPRAQNPGNQTMNRVYPETRSMAPNAAAPTAPLTPRSPRSTEHYNSTGTGHYNSPSAAPNYAPVPGHAGQSYAAPRGEPHAAPSYSAPSRGDGGGARGDGGGRQASSGGGGRGDGGGAGGGRGDGGRGDGGGRNR